MSKKNKQNKQYQRQARQEPKKLKHGLVRPLRTSLGKADYSSDLATFLEGIRITPMAWAKIWYLCNYCSTEISMIGISAKDDKFLIEDIKVLKQYCNEMASDYEQEAMFAHFNESFDAGMMDRAMRIFIHTHPGESSTPSTRDMDTFHGEFFQHHPWQVMLIVAKGGSVHCRIRAKTHEELGTYVEGRIPVCIDYERSNPETRLDIQELRELADTLILPWSQNPDEILRLEQLEEKRKQEEEEFNRRRQKHIQNGGGSGPGGKWVPDPDPRPFSYITLPDFAGYDEDFDDEEGFDDEVYVIEHAEDCEQFLSAESAEDLGHILGVPNDYGDYLDMKRSLLYFIVGCVLHFKVSPYRVLPADTQKEWNDTGVFPTILEFASKGPEGIRHWANTEVRTAMEWWGWSIPDDEDPVDKLYEVWLDRINNTLQNYGAASNS